MTFDDDFCRFEFPDGAKNITCKTIGLTWPPPEKVMVSKVKFKMESRSQLSDEVRKGMTHVARGAKYNLVDTETVH